MLHTTLSVVGLVAAVAMTEAAGAGAKPHIFMVIVDDFGWADVGFHRATPTPEVVTPTMDALVKEGIELDRHYVHMMCTPTRSSFYSGRLPIHVLTKLSSPCDRNGAIARNMTGIAAKLKTGGYMTHHIGKWDAGMATPHHTPHGRGYDTSLNYFGHGNWMWSEREWLGSCDHRGSVPGPYEELNGTIVDFWDTDRPARSLNGTGYEEYLFRDRVHSILTTHDQSKPLFLTYASKIVHYPLQVPEEYQEKFGFITDIDNRRVYHAMVNFLDDQLLNFTTTMKNLGMWENTLMVLTSDNGGYVGDNKGGCNHSGTAGLPSTDWGHNTACFNGEAGANNFPLRGGKYSMFEGGIRVNAFVSGGFLPQHMRGTKLSGPNSMIHIVDWHATFCALADVNPGDPWGVSSGLPDVDGVDVWPLISGQNMTSPRTTILVNEQLLVHKQWKFVPNGTNMIEASWGGLQYPNGSSQSDSNWITNYHHICSTPLEGCLFDVVADPTEQGEVGTANPSVVSMMSELLEEISKTIYTVDHSDDPACKKFCEAHYGGFYGPWKELPDGWFSHEV